MRVKARHSFPASFLWGTATSSHQVEGDNTTNDWWDWEQEDGRILGGSRSLRACEWWQGRWREDLDRAAEGHQNAHRLSLEWSRIEPEPGKWDEEALAHYQAIIRGVRDRGLHPLVTLHHFTNPRWLADRGGWREPSVVAKFARYVRKTVEALGDQAAMWITINEPNVYAYASHAAGLIPPGVQSVSQSLEVMANMTRAHAASYEVIHRLQPNAQVGLAHHYRAMAPANPGNPLDRLVTSLRSGIFNEAIPRALDEGVLRFPWKRIQVPEAKGTQDFFGLNYYTQERVAFSPFHISELMGRGFYAEDADVSPTGFIANQPEGFARALRWARGFDLPIYVTENGVEDPQDDLRRRYLALHIRRLWDAVNRNWQVKGYFHWTLVDNFEWERGWTQPFGLWALDPETQQRTKRPSADFYAEICESSSLSSEMVAKYAPEVQPEVFPQDPPGHLASQAGGS